MRELVVLSVFYATMLASLDAKLGEYMKESVSAMSSVVEGVILIWSIEEVMLIWSLKISSRMHEGCFRGEYEN